MAQLKPILPFQLSIARTDRIGVKAEAARNFSRAGQALPGNQVTAQDAQDRLRDKLFAERNFSSAREPEFHAAYLNAAFLVGHRFFAAGARRAQDDDRLHSGARPCRAHACGNSRSVIRGDLD